MKWIKFLALLGALCIASLAGCTDTSGGAAGDPNDPTTSGSDEEQMDEQAEDVDTSNVEE